MTKRLILAFSIFLFTVSGLLAQSYSVGTPVRDTLIHGFSPFMDTGYYPCAFYEFSVDTAVLNHPAGISYYFKITSNTLPLNCLRETNSGRILNTGDSMQLNTAQSVLDFGTKCGGGNFQAVLFAEGIPIVANDSFYCKSQLSGGTATYADGCTFFMQSVWFNTVKAKACYVNEPVPASIRIVQSPGFCKLSPNPSSGLFSIQMQTDAPSTLEIFTLLGQQIFSQKLQNTLTDIDLSAEPKGMYFYSIVSKTSEIGSGKILIQ